ncbi:outer membrane protein [Mesorhizobium sp. ANAO-SY3R2]|uniref:outer membrane protein n=1 Tax=Mesorhizobium sp. ANAO-SY3R2 TaxID=3166644 RepID=UPI00366B8AF4
MKSVLLASAALALVVPDAYAQNGAYDWSGSYVGVEAGYAHSSVDFDGDRTKLADSYNEDGFLGGVYVGHDWQAGNLIYGVVADFDAISVDDIAFEAFDIFGGGKGEAYTYDIDWAATARARVGYTPVDRLLVYGTGGLAAAHFEASSYDYPWGGVSLPSQSDFRGIKLGGVFGAGVEYAFSGNWSAKTELLHYIFDDIEPGPGGMPGASFSPTLTTVKFGLAYRF